MVYVRFVFNFFGLLFSLALLACGLLAYSLLKVRAVTPARIPEVCGNAHSVPFD